MVLKVKKYTERKFKNYTNATKFIKGKKGSFMVRQIPRDEQGRFEIFIEVK